MGSLCTVAAEREKLGKFCPRANLPAATSEKLMEPITLPTEHVRVPLELWVPLHAHFPCQGRCYCYQRYIRGDCDQGYTVDSLANS